MSISWVGFLMNLTGTIVMIYILAKQTSEIFRPKDGFTNLRWFLFVVLLLSVMASVPALTYQYFRATGNEYELLRSIATIFGNIRTPLNAVLLVLIWNYKYKE